MASSPLPSFRRRALSLSSFNVPRRYHTPIFVLQAMCLVPALLGFFHQFSRAWNPPTFDPTHLFHVKSTPLIYYVSILWCLLVGYWSWILTTSMARRWLYRYQVTNVMGRLLLLNTTNWVGTLWVYRSYGPDQPIWTWMVVSGALLVANVGKLIWSATVDARAKYQKTDLKKTSQDIHYRSTVVRVLVMPLMAVLFITMFAMLFQVGRMRATAAPLHMTIDAKPHPAFTDPDHLRVMVFVLSAWTPKSLEKRRIFRETTMQLLGDTHPQVDFHVQFVIGHPPTDQVRAAMSAQIEQEMAEFGDVQILDTSDKYEDLSKKVYAAMEWMDQYQFDYLVKTDDDIFVRWDTISQELHRLGPQQRYWQGLAYWNIPPIRDTSNKNSEMDYTLPLFPPYTAGALYILSRDVVRLVAGVGGPRLFVKNEDQNLGIWLFPYNIRPIHDRRIQQIDACEEDMIAKHFGDFGEEGAIGGTMYDMLNNLRGGRKMCQGFRVNVCAMCYPCNGKGTNWREWGFACNDVKGVTLLNLPELTLID
ncbi:galactosyltransferase-domain-containing protein [Gongronella butleri]|nr:galactosyltransferase-domain-containing protein [Gongronella butleri]